MSGTGEHLHRPLQLLHLLTQTCQITPWDCTTTYIMLQSEYRHTNTQCCSQSTDTQTHNVAVRVYRHKHTMLQSEYRHTNTQCCSQSTDTMITYIMSQPIYTQSVAVRLHRLCGSQSTNAHNRPAMHLFRDTANSHGCAPGFLVKQGTKVPG